MVEIPEALREPLSGGSRQYIPRLPFDPVIYPREAITICPSQVFSWTRLRTRQRTSSTGDYWCTTGAGIQVYNIPRGTRNSGGARTSRSGRHVFARVELWGIGRRRHCGRRGTGDAVDRIEGGEMQTRRPRFLVPSTRFPVPQRQKTVL